MNKRDIINKYKGKLAYVIDADKNGSNTKWLNSIRPFP
jgi:hypothetical protein